MWGDLPERQSSPNLVPAQFPTLLDATPTAQPPAPPKSIDFESILVHLVSSSAHFQNQQRDEPELTEAQKRHIAHQLWSEQPAQFLARFGRYLSPSQLDFCQTQCPNPSQALQDQFQILQPGRTRRRNRRYRWMQSMLKQNHDYFATETMRQRNPLLFEQICGSDLSLTERSQDRSDCRLSSIILDHLDLDRAREKRRFQAQSQPEEEFDSENDEEESLGDTRVSTQEKERLRTEFRELMCQQFLNGRDADFDYAQVDHDPTWDDWDVLDREAEEAYFDAD